jgi:hypothetical protein
LTCSSAGWPRGTRRIASQQPGDQQSDPEPSRRPQPVGVENPVASCGLQVLVDESAEAVASEVPNVGAGRCRSGSSCRWSLIEGSVRPVAVVVRGVLAQDVGEVAWSGDEDAVEAFAAQGRVVVPPVMSTTAPSPTSSAVFRCHYLRKWDIHNPDINATR